MEMKRYDKYKDSGVEWIGEVPAGWEVRKGKNIFNQRSTKGSNTNTLLSATQKNGMYPQHLVEGVVQVKQDTDLSTFKTVLKNDFVISLRSFQGGFEMSEYEGVCSPAYQVFYNKINIHHKFWKYLFKSHGFITQINAFTMGIREGKNIQYFDFSLMQLPFPPLSEQQVIAEYLDGKCGEIDALVGLQEEMIGELRAYKQSVITEAVTKGIDNGDGGMRRYRDSGVEWIGEIPEEWEVSSIKNISNIFTGSTPSTSNIEYYNDNDIYWYSPSDLSENKIHLGKSNKMLSNRTLIDGVIKLYPSGTILLIGIGGTLGRVGYSHNECASNQQINAIIVKDGYCSLFYTYMLSIMHSYIWINANTSTMPILNQSANKKLEVVIPPLAEQQQIADYLDKKCEQIDELIAVKEAKIVELKEWKKSVIFEYVTGKKKV